MTDGIRITAITDKTGQQARIGCGISPSDLSALNMISLAFGGKAPRLYLGLLFRMAADDRGRYPMVRSSVTAAWRAVRGRGAASRDARTSSGRN